MKKMLKIMVVAGIVGVMALAFAGGLNAAISLPPAVARCGNNPGYGSVRELRSCAYSRLRRDEPDTPGSVTVFCIQTEGDLTYLVFMPTAEGAGHPATSAQALSFLTMDNVIRLAKNHAAEHTSIVNMLPEPETIAALGLAGLLWNRSSRRRPSRSRGGQKDADGASHPLRDFVNNSFVKERKV